MKANKNKLAYSLVLGIFMAVAAIVAEQKRIDFTKQKNIEELNLKLDSFVRQVEDWDNLNSLALSNLVKQPDIISMKPSRQKPILENMVKIYQHLYLAHTVDLTGNNVARSDSNQSKYYGDRDWFAGVLLGIDINRQTVMGLSNKAPALCVGAPIRQQDNIVGAATLCTDLSDLAEVVGKTHLGQTGYLIVVDSKGRVLLHPNSAFLSGKNLKDLSEYPPVKHILEGREGEFTFTENREKWLSLGTSLESGWKVMLVIGDSEISPSFSSTLILIAIGLTVIVFIFWNLIDSWSELKPKQLIKSDEGDKAPQIIDGATIKHTPPPLPPKENCSNYQAYLGKERWILIVDDNMENQQYCSTILGALGFKIVTTNNSESAYNIVKTRLFDLVLTNLHLRVGSGKTIMFSLRKNRDYSTIPIIGITNRIAKKREKKYLSGFSDFLEEPLDKKTLVALVGKHLNLSWKIPKARIVQFPQQQNNSATDSK